jgi:ferritin-like metal-binding protein YciE
MAKPQDLHDLYIEELMDLWSANDQMERVLKKIAGKASDQGLAEMLEKSVAGVGRHTALLKELLAAQDEKTPKEHCKGMEGLVEEAKSHILEEGPKKGAALDAVIITQYQRMTH